MAGNNVAQKNSLKKKGGGGRNFSYLIKLKFFAKKISTRLWKLPNLAWNYVPIFLTVHRTFLQSLSRFTACLQ
jgi:hypothetical protein